MIHHFAFYSKSIIELKLRPVVVQGHLTSAIQLAMAPEFGEKWEAECLDTKFPLRTLIHVSPIYTV